MRDATDDQRRSTPIDRLLRLFAPVRDGEGGPVLILAANLFVLLFAYYLLKTVREPLILGEHGGSAEIKSYASACQAVFLAALVVGFSWLAGKVPRMKLIAAVTAFFIVDLIVFWAAFHLWPSARLVTGIAFFIWVGCFNVMVIAQFWSFAADLYSREAGERVFAVIAGGSAMGAVVGAKAAKPLYRALGPYPILLVTAGLLAVALLLTWLAHRQDARDPTRRERRHSEPVNGKGGFALVLHDRYLQLVAALTLVKNWVNTTGEYILDRRLLEVAHARFGNDVAAVEKFVAGFKSDYFTYVNIAVMVLQFFAVSRIIRYVGVRRALYVMPILALASYGTMAFIPVLTVIFVGKIAENATDYSLQKTVEQTLFLVTSREAKYKAKAVIDTFIVRVGDLLSAALVWSGTHLHFSTTSFILANGALLVGLLLIVVRLTRAHREQADQTHDTGQRVRVESDKPHPRPGMVPALDPLR